MNTFLYNCYENCSPLIVVGEVISVGKVVMPKSQVDVVV